MFKEGSVILKAAFVVICAFTLSILGFFTARAQTRPSALYIPLIGISSVPEPLSLPKGPGNVTYHYAVKNFRSEASLTDIQVNDSNCSPIKFVEGDDNDDSKLDYSETWRYTCTIKLSETTQSIATAIGTSNNLPATHKAYTTVVVGSDKVAPMVNIINISKIAYPLSLPAEGGDITFTYRVNNPGVVPLSNVSVTDDKCAAMSSKLGDKNANGLLDITEVWIYTCTTHLYKTTTNTVSVTSYANGLKAVGYATLTVTVDTPGPGISGQVIPSFPTTGDDPTMKYIVWATLAGALAILIIPFFLNRKRKLRK